MSLHAQICKYFGTEGVPLRKLIRYFYKTYLDQTFINFLCTFLAWWYHGGIFFRVQQQQNHNKYVLVQFPWVFSGPFMRVSSILYMTWAKGPIMIKPLHSRSNHAKCKGPIMRVPRFYIYQCTWCHRDAWCVMRDAWFRTCNSMMP